MAMVATNHWAEYAIDRPMATRPGTRFVHNTGGSQLVSAVVSLLTRRPAADLAAARLFSTLGIRDFEWANDPQAQSAGGSV
jgi:CubicO group peptidase (beta-lactamase class C family)